MKVVRRFCTLLIGFVLFVAGILKLMDPTGASLIATEYFKFLGVPFLEFASRAAAVTLALSETLVGAALLTGVWRRVIAIVSGALLLSFTGLTVALVIGNPPMDCGCFGEAIHLTHWQTLIKNIILLVLWTIAFVPAFEDIPVRKIKYAAFAIAAVSVTAFSFYSAAFQPLVDFTDYAPGRDLGENILSFSDAQGGYADSTALDGPVMVVSVYDPDRMEFRDWSRTAELLDLSEGLGYTSLLLVSDTPADFSARVMTGNLPERAFFADRRTLLALNRSNGGAVVINDGTVVRKWPSRRQPSFGDLSDIISGNPAEATARGISGGRLRLQAFLLYVFAVMLLL